MPISASRVAGAGEIEAVARDVGIVPFRVFGRDEAVGRLRAAAIDLAHQAVAVNGAGDGLAELLVPEPFQPGRIDEGFARGVGAGVLVEPEEVAFGADAEFKELEAPAGGGLLELRVILRAHRIADVALALEEQGRLAARTCRPR